MRNRLWPKKRIRGSVPQTKVDLKKLSNEFLRLFWKPSFCFHAFGIGLTGNFWHQKYKNKKEGFKNYLKYLFKRLLKISLRLRYRGPDPVFGQNRILIPRIKYWIFYSVIILWLPIGVHIFLRNFPRYSSKNLFGLSNTITYHLSLFPREINLPPDFSFLILCINHFCPIRWSTIPWKRFATEACSRMRRTGSKVPNVGFSEIINRWANLIILKYCKKIVKEFVKRKKIDNRDFHCLVKRKHILKRKHIFF